MPLGFQSILYLRQALADEKGGVMHLVRTFLGLHGQRVTYEIAGSKARFTVFLRVETKRRRRYFVAGFPDLDIWSQAPIREKAEKNAIEVLAEILTDALRDGIIDKFLKQRGFRLKEENASGQLRVEMIPFSPTLRAAIFSHKLANPGQNLHG